MIDRNPSAPSHVSKAQATRLTKMTLNRLRYLIKTGRITLETHYGSKMVPMWSLTDFMAQEKPNELE